MANPMATASTTGFTCLACQVQFRTAEQQRNHYRTDWHRYNLKRKVADLPPVTAENFADRVSAAQSFAQQETLSRSVKPNCDVCKKTYATENAYQNHLTSKKHKEMVEQQAKNEKNAAVEKEVEMEEAVEETEAMARLKEDSRRAREYQRKLLDARSESEVMEILEDKMRTAIKLNPDSDCLFCTHQSSSMEENLEHMTEQHSFFIPDIEFLQNMNGLLQYLADKISVQSTCLYCNGKGKGFHSLEAVRTHMVDKGHCKIAYDDGADLEVAEFYDFSSTWADEGDADAELGQTATGPVETEDMELALPSGIKLGHRSLRRYYNQYHRPQNEENEKESVLIQRMYRRYHVLGWYDDAEHQEAARRAETRRRRHQMDHDMRVGVKSNKLQRYFRAQIDF